MKKTKTTTERIKSMSRVLSIILKIARICCYVGIGISVVGVIYSMIFGNIDLLVLNGNIVVHSPFNSADLSGIDTTHLIYLAVFGIIALGLMANLFRQAGNIFKDISQDSTPFEMKHVKRIKRIAVIYLIISLFDFEKSGASTSITLNIVGIVGALMFWCIALIFEYGCELQKESDETL